MTGRVTIEDLLPHRGTMLLINTIVQAADDFVQTQSIVTPYWPLVNEAGANPIVLIELAAQTAGICFGWKSMHASPHSAESAGTAPQGWLVGVKRAHFRVGSIAVQSCITTESKIAVAVQDYIEVASTCHVGDTQIGEIQLQVLRAEATAFQGVSG